MKNIAIVGSTGSIGTQALEVALERGYRVCALSAGSNIDLLEQQARLHRPLLVSLRDEQAATELRNRLTDMSVKVSYGEVGAQEVAAFDTAELTLNAAVGIAGLLPSIAALNAGKQLALANKETLVCAGEQIMSLAAKKKVAIIPVDSEHSAVFQAMQGCSKGEVARIILTASGGPFFGKTREEMKYARPSDALKHPSWSMGAKITIDSATMMNKGFEIIEAAWLFAVPQKNIEVTVHRESVVHSFVEFCDGSVLAQMSPPDMRLPIQYAIDYGSRWPSNRRKMDFGKVLSFTFSPPDYDAFPAISLCKRVLDMGGNTGAVLNGANEEAVALFLDEKIGFLDICDRVEKAVKCIEFIKNPSIERIIESDRQARAFVNNF